MNIQKRNDKVSCKAIHFRGTNKDAKYVYYSHKDNFYGISKVKTKKLDYKGVNVTIIAWACKGCMANNSCQIILAIQR